MASSKHTLSDLCRHVVELDDRCAQLEGELSDERAQAAAQRARSLRALKAGKDGLVAYRSYLQQLGEPKPGPALDCHEALIRMVDVLQKELM